MTSSFLVLLTTEPNLEICSGWIETPRPLRGETHPAGLQRELTLSHEEIGLQPREKQPITENH